MYVGMKNYEYYDPEFCDGNFCCRDCERCPIAQKIMEAEEGSTRRILKRAGGAL